MRCLVRLFRGRAWPAIVGSGLLLGVFHLLGSGPIGTEELLIGSANASGGIFFGWIFWAYGFEYLVLAHALAHMITLGFA